MNKNLSSSLLAITIAVLVVAGCNMSKNDTVNNAGGNWGNTAPNTPDAAPAPSNNMPSSKVIAWELGNKTSMAAILYDLKGTETSDSLTKAKTLANEVGADIPSFPTKSGDKTKDTAAILGYLLNDVFKNVGNKVKAKYGQKEASLFEISLKSNVLLLIYGAGAKEGKTVATVIRNNAKIAELPETLWMPVVTKIESDASFDEVKTAVLEMQTSVSQYLGKS